MSLSKSPLRVDSLFHSLQGEGPLAGRPSHFLRLHGCNLRCRFCDTPRPQGGASFLPLTCEEALERLLNLYPGRENLVVTGGEPLLQREALKEFFQRANPLFTTREIETNGTIPPGELSGMDLRFNVSPKLSGSGISLQERLVWPALEEFSSLPKAFFKFVVGSEGEADEALQVVVRLKIPLERTALMVCGGDRDTVDRGACQTARWALERGMGYCDRLHLRLGIE